MPFSGHFDKKEKKKIIQRLVIAITMQHYFQPNIIGYQLIAQECVWLKVIWMHRTDPEDNCQDMTLIGWKWSGLEDTFSKARRNVSRASRQTSLKIRLRTLAERNTRVEAASVLRKNTGVGTSGGAQVYAAECSRSPMNIDIVYI